MMFMVEMMLAFALIVATTTVMTIFAMSLMRWMLGAGQLLSQVHTPPDASLDDGAQTSRAIS